jgi:signal transduction histidine kinase
MLAKQPFARRIVIAFTLMTLVVSGAFSLSIIAVVHLIEEHLVTEELGHELDSILNEVLVQNAPPRLEAAKRFYASNLPQYAIPEMFSSLQPGFTEILHNEGAYYAYLREMDGERYILVQEQNEIEARENVLYDVVLAGFLLTILGAWALGRLMAYKIMAPVSRLAEQVRHQDQLHPLAPPLAPQYPGDEVGQLAAAFDSTLGQLRQTLHREMLFTSDVSHELRTPLMVVLGACELLEQASLSGKSRSQVHRIKRAVQEMHELVQTFLILARATPEQSALNGSASIADVAQQQAERWRPLFADKGLAFEIIEEHADSSKHNHTLLSTVMSNLLRNALHYTETGSVRLILEGAGFRVEDTGVGIPPEQQQQLFEPFVRGPEARGEGLGLGLSLVKRICAHQQWQVTVQQLSPCGTKFHVRLYPPT